MCLCCTSIEALISNVVIIVVVASCCFRPVLCTIAGVTPVVCVTEQLCHT